MENNGFTFVQAPRNLGIGSRAMARLNLSQICPPAFDDKHAPIFSRAKERTVWDAEDVIALPDNYPYIEPEIITKRGFLIYEIGYNIDTFFLDSERRYFRYCLRLNRSYMRLDRLGGSGVFDQHPRSRPNSNGIG